MARDIIAVLTAVNRRYSEASRTAALLTHFFNIRPDAIPIVKDNDMDLYQSKNLSEDNNTISHINNISLCQRKKFYDDNERIASNFDYWGVLADRQLWPQLFSSIIEKTEIRQRLIRLKDGERKLADLRQVTDYCVEYLYRQNSNLEQLIEHLTRLYNNEENAGEDKNIYMLETEKSSVQILTMHASKGLEFPVVFLMTRGKISLQRGPNILRYVDDDGTRRFIPYISIDRSKDGKAVQAQRTKAENDQKRERRRLLYVAMTRPQAMLFVPMTEKEKDLSPRL
jgi:ATP-dependent exoDNAse (exonuclease V) beta subunit